jgi:hypothetical protein
MTINRTTLLDLPLPVTGTESGTWGDVTNNGLAQYVDIAVAGMNNLTSANFSSGALTISNTLGTSAATNIAAGSAQYATIKVSSLAQNSTITAPASNRSYRIVNLDSTYNLTIKASGQTGITFLPGQTGVVAFTGTDYEVVGVVNAASSTDNAVPRFDGTTGQIIQTSSVVIDDSGNLTTVGLNTSGAVVFNDAGADVDFRVEGDTDANLLFVDASTDRVGIGTSSPTTKLQVDGPADIGGETNNVGIFGSSSTNAGIIGTTANQQLNIFGNGTGPIVFQTGGAFLNGLDVLGTERMRITSAGDVGIGTSSPATKFHVSNTSGATQVRVSSDTDVSFSATATGADSTAFMTVLNDARQWTIRVNGSESDQFQIRDSTAGATRMVIDSSGNVVLGSSANGGQAMTTLQGYSPNSANGSYGNLLFSANANYTGGASRFLLTNAFNVTDFAIISSVDATTTPTLDSGGAVSSGTVVFSLKAGGNAAFLGNIGIGGATPSSSGAGITFPATQSASSDANTLDDYEEGTTTVTFTPSTSGTITLNTSYQTVAYTKVGRLVTITGELFVSSVSTPVGTSVSIGNLPFAAGGALTALSSGFGILDLGTGSVVGARVNTTANTIDLRVDASTIGANYNIVVGFSYMT